MTIKKAILAVLYLLTVTVSFYLSVYGGGYYFISLSERSHHSLHDTLKPGGFGGHGLGVVGTAMMLLLLLYLARKYSHSLRKWGSIGFWLDVHIWLGITGPILVTFHTAFKFGGIITISFWSMVAVVASGIFGRYIYLQIPRRLSGEELTEEEIQKMDQTLTEQLANLPTVSETLSKHIQSLLKYTEKSHDGRFSGIRFWLEDSLQLRFQLWALRRELHAKTKLNRYMVSDLIRVIKERRLLNRRTVFLKVAQRILHHWHLIHRPFAAVMYIIATVHVLVATLLGYTWVF